jgi:hypothetical protein
VTRSVTIADVYNAVANSWSLETSTKWLPLNPAQGQCSVTLLVVQRYLGGDILKTMVDGHWHFYNRVERQRIDLTKCQFSGPIVYDDHLSNRREAFSDTSQQQYESLLASVQDELAKGQREITSLV